MIFRCAICYQPVKPPISRHTEKAHGLIWIRELQKWKAPALPPDKEAKRTISLW